MKTAIRLQEFELELDIKRINTLLLLAAYYNKSYKYCSRACIKLETLKNLNDEEKERITEVAVSIFSKHAPVDGSFENYACPNEKCKNQVSE